MQHCTKTIVAAAFNCDFRRKFGHRPEPTDRSTLTQTLAVYAATMGSLF